MDSSGPLRSPLDFLKDSPNPCGTWLGNPGQRQEGFVKMRFRYSNEGAHLVKPALLTFRVFARLCVVSPTLKLVLGGSLGWLLQPFKLPSLHNYSMHCKRTS